MSKYKRTKTLTEKSEMRIRRAQDVITGLKIDKDYGWRMQINIETVLVRISCSSQTSIHKSYLNSLKNRSF